MDFLEKIFGLAPDGGNGSLELSITLVLVLAVTARSRIRQWKRVRDTHSQNLASARVMLE